MPNSVDAVALVANHLILAGRLAKKDAPLAAVEVEIPGAPPVRAPVAAEHRSPPARRTRKRAEDAGAAFLLACPLGFDAAKALAAAPHERTVRLVSADRPLSERTLTVGSFEQAGMHAYADAVRALCAAMATGSPDFARILASIAAGEHAAPSIWCSLETRLVAPDCGLVAEGHTDGLGARNVVFLLDDFRIAIDPGQIFVEIGRRPGREATGGSGSAPPPRAPHSFACFDAVGGHRHELRLAATSDVDVRWSDPLTLDEPATPRRLLEAIARLVPAGDLMLRPSAANAARRIALRGGAAQPTASMIEYLKDDTRPELSLVVLFDTDSFSLIDHIESQRRADLAAEWVFACDDPALLPTMKHTCRAWRGGMRKTTRLLGFGERAGYAAANNAGFRSASAAHLLFIGSEVYWRSFAPFAYGLSLLRDDPTVGVVGFALHFEDGTVAHAGMELQVTPEMDDMLLPLQVGRGLPGEPRGAAIGAREVEAVTGALMVRRDDFDGAVFDEGYAGGEFEDYDLCLQMRMRGKKVVLVDCPDVFRLQPRSPRDEGALNILSTINCIRFNEKWRARGVR